MMIKIIKGDIVFFQSKWRGLFYDYSREFPCWATILDNNQVVYLENTQEMTACNIRTFCNYHFGKYSLLYISQELALLYPDEDTKYQLGIHTYNDSSIDVPYDTFIDEVTDIWEERTPIEGFKFDVEPIVYLKKDGVWLVEH